MRKSTLALGIAAMGATLAAIPIVLEARIAKSAQRLDETWKRVAVSPRGHTLLGISFRPLQVEAFGLDTHATLRTLLAYPFQLIRLPAYWNRVEPRTGVFDTSELDWQLDAAERAGKEVILSVGAVKNFGYPEFYVPKHQLEQALPEGSLIGPATHEALLSGAQRFVERIVSRYRDRKCLTVWQLEHEAVDPLGMEHSWRLSETFVRAELDVLRAADPSRPVLMNGFLPTSSVVRLSQWWRTRDQGDSLAVATRLADIIGIDHYPRHALFAMGGRTLYMDATRLPWQRALIQADLRATLEKGKRVMVSEGQAEPWEAVTSPPNPDGSTMFSCRPEHVIQNYNASMSWGDRTGSPLYAYLFWGAEYWILRSRSGDPSYVKAFGRILEESG